MLKPRRIFVFPIAVTFSVLFILYIISWFSPIAGDSFIHDRTGYLGQFHIRHVWKACVDSYLYWNPRLGEMAAFFITSAPRLVWTVLNPVFVLALVLGLYVLALGENAQSPAGVRRMDMVVCFKHVRLSRGNRLLCLPDTRRLHELCVDRMPDRMVHEYLQNQVGEADNLLSLGPVLRMSDLWDFLRRL